MIKYLLLVIPVCLLIISCEDFYNRDYKNQKELFSKIKIGMRKEKVIEILGKPNNIQLDSSDQNNLYFYYSLKSKIALHSEMPTIMFDSLGLVKFSNFGD